MRNGLYPAPYGDRPIANGVCPATCGVHPVTKGEYPATNRVYPIDSGVFPMRCGVLPVCLATVIFDTSISPENQTAMSKYGGPFPSKEADFNNYVNVAVPYMTADAASARLRISTQHVDDLKQGLEAWNKSYALSINPNTRTRTVTDQKALDKADLMNTIRAVFDDIPASALTPEDRSTLGLPERRHPSDSPIPATAPIGHIDNSNRQQQTISWTDADGSRARPHGVRGCRLYLHIGDTPPSGIAGCSFIALDTASPYVYHFDAADFGKTAYWILCWENTRGEAGPISDTVSATITR